MNNSMIEKIRAIMSKAESSNSPSESATALELARKLMMKYKISEEEVEEYEVVEALNVGELDYLSMLGVKRQTQKFVEMLAASVAKLFNVRVLIEHQIQYDNNGKAKIKRNRKSSRYETRKMMLVVGTPENREVFSYVFSSLVNQCFTQCEAAQIKGEQNGTLHFVRNSAESYVGNSVRFVERRMYISDFYNGFVVTISSRIREIIKQDSSAENAIVVAEKAIVDAWINKEYGKLEKNRCTVRKDATGGKKDGKIAGKNANLSANGLNSGGKSKISGYLE